MHRERRPAQSHGPGRDMGAGGDIEAAPSGPCEHRLPTVDVGGVAMLCHPGSGTLFSPGGHGFRRGPSHRYDRRGLDVSVRYSAGALAMVSIYVFPFAPPRTADSFREAFDTAVADMLARVHVQREADERQVAFADATLGAVGGRRYEVTGALREGLRQIVHGLVELFASPTWLLKVRATCQPASRAALESFLGTWLASSSFGGR